VEEQLDALVKMGSLVLSETVPSAGRAQPELAVVDDRMVWDKFHAVHNKALKYYKDKRYLLQAFPEIVSSTEKIIFEVGAGTGAAMWPILEASPNARFVGVDFEGPVELLKKRRCLLPATVQSKLHFFVCDATKDDLVTPAVVEAIPAIESGADVVLMIFCLSACPVASYGTIFKKISQVLKAGGILCFRDYGLYDTRHLKAMKNIALSLERRNNNVNKKSETKPVKDAWRMLESTRSFLRNDDTRAYFFSKEDVDSLARGAGLSVLRSEYACVKNVNRKDQSVRYRCFLNAVYMKE
jgi:methyltransferase-like protein 6